MNLSAEAFTIRLPKPFRIAHGSSDTRQTILVHLHDPATGLTGHGEGALPPYYPSTVEACLAWLSAPQAPPPREAAAAVAALNIARHDLDAQIRKTPMWKSFGSSQSKIPPCARTLSIPQDEVELREALRGGWALGSRHFKLKSGSGDFAWDLQCVKIAREEFPEISLSLDANAGWSPTDAAAIIAESSSFAYIEQPVSADWSAWQELISLLSRPSRVPLVADESIQGLPDIAAAAQFCAGINVKLLKAGGLDGARAWIHAARASGLRVLLGCMVETGIGRTATAQLAPFADWLDIDPPDSIPLAPLCGIDFSGDLLTLSDAPGLGLRSVG